VGAAIAAAKGIDVADVADVTWENAAMVYQLP
jgi:Tat protein secretion system quality control protein TatD with DNase activity